MVMTNEKKIVELAGAIRLLAWHVARLSSDSEVSAELAEVRNSMQKVAEACATTSTPAFLDAALNEGDGAYKP